VATRPDAVTLAPVVAALETRGTFDQILVDTGEGLVGDVLTDLGLPEPGRTLRIASGSDSARTAGALAAGEELLAALEPAAIVVTGAASSTLGLALAATKLGLPVARMQAGLREHDWSVPEEVNRVLLDRVADLLFASSADAAANLAMEGAIAGNVTIVGSTVVDVLRRAGRCARDRAVWLRYGVAAGSYVLVTMQAPLNLDDDERLARIVEGLATLASRVPVVFPLAPRTRSRLTPMGDAHRLLAAGVLCGPPLSYLDFLSLQAGAGAVITDSGMVQEESSALGVSCFTLRPATDRPVTVTHGTNVLINDDPRDIGAVRPAAGAPMLCTLPMWDGHAGDRITDALIANYAIVRASGVS